MPQHRFSFLITPFMVLIESFLLFIVLFYYIDIEYLQTKGYSLNIKNLFYAHYKAYIILGVSWFFIGSYFSIYTIQRGKGLVYYLQRTIYQLLIFSVLLFAVSGLKEVNLLGITNSVLFLGVFSISILFFRILFLSFLKWYRIAGYNSRNVLFVDSNTNTLNIIDFLTKRKDYGYSIKGIINGKKVEGLSIQNFDLPHFKSLLFDENINLIFLSLGGSLTQEIISEIKLIAVKKRIQLNFIPSSAMLGYNDLELNFMETFPILSYSHYPLENIFLKIAKRIFDILFSFILLSILLVTLFPLIGLLIVIDSGFPIFFIQKRRGLDGKVFNCYKFRSKKVNKESNKKTTFKGDLRITKIGMFLRKSSLDELPQFFNVLKGDMSVVGPRPHMVSQDDEYSKLINQYSLRHHVKPGITGMAQVSGHRGEIYSEKDMKLRVQSDMYYIKNWSFLLDIFIIIKTTLKMIFGDKNAI